MITFCNVVIRFVQSNSLTYKVNIYFQTSTFIIYKSKISILLTNNKYKIRCVEVYFDTVLYIECKQVDNCLWRHYLSRDIL